MEEWCDHFYKEHPIQDDMKTIPIFVPEPYVIEEIEKRRLPNDERVPLQLPLPVFPDPKPEKTEERVVTIQL